MLFRLLVSVLILCAMPEAGWGAFAPSSREMRLQEQLVALEGASGGRLGVALINTKDGSLFAYRGNERFPMSSTFKTIVAAAILKQSEQDRLLLERRLPIRHEDLVDYSPVTEQNITGGMTVAELCAATVQISDNAAANILMGLLGGPQGVTAFARSMGDTSFRLDRWEPGLNEAVPGDERDTTTPASMAALVRHLVLGDALAPAQQEQLRTWLLGNTTGNARIRAGVPADWQVGDKTGGGAYGTTNDVAVLWPSQGAPVVLALYFTQPVQNARARNEVLAAATRIVCDTL